MDEKLKKVNVGLSGLIHFSMSSPFSIEELANIYKAIV